MHLNGKTSNKDFYLSNKLFTVISAAYTALTAWISYFLQFNDF